MGFKNILFAGAMLLAFSGVEQAQAGFQLISPSASAEKVEANVAARAVKEPANVAPASEKVAPMAAGLSADDLQRAPVLSVPSLDSSVPVAAAPAAVPTKVAPVMAPSIAAVAEQSSEPVVNGFADNIPLVMALRNIVPAGYQLSYGASVNLSEKTSFNGGKPWKEVLSEVLEPVKLSYQQRGNIIYVRSAFAAPAPEKVAPVAAHAAPVAVAPLGGKEAELQPPAAVPVPVASVPMAPMPEEAAPVIQQVAGAEPAEVPGEALKTVEVESNQPPVAVAPIAVGGGSAAPVALPKWQAQKGLSLHQVLDGWAKDAGWNVSWETDYDYRLEANAEFTGSFPQAVEEAVNAFANAYPPVLVTVYKNNTLVISQLPDDSAAF